MPAHSMWALCAPFPGQGALARPRYPHALTLTPGGRHSLFCVREAAVPRGSSLPFAEGLPSALAGLRPGQQGFEKSPKGKGGGEGQLSPLLTFMLTLESNTFPTS